MSSNGREEVESLGLDTWSVSEASSGDSLELKGQTMKTWMQVSLGQSEEKPVPAAHVPSPVAPVPKLS